MAEGLIERAGERMSVRSRRVGKMNAAVASLSRDLFKRWERERVRRVIRAARVHTPLKAFKDEGLVFVDERKADPCSRN